MYDVAIIGAGIVGLSVAHELLNHKPNLKIILLEKESKVGQHQSGNNSGVIHSGIYYEPGSLKALNCRRGVSLLLKFCKKNNIAYDLCGKVIIASNEMELEKLDLLKNRGEKNGILGIKNLKLPELLDYEPYSKGVGALFCPETGIVDYGHVCNKLSEKIQQKTEIAVKEEVLNINKKQECFIITTKKSEYKAKFLINCAGLFSDKISALCGLNRDIRIIPFRGEYFTLKKESRYLVKNLIYPVPDPSYPFLGVHFTRMIGGGVEAGPNAVLAWAREGYRKTDINFLEMWDYLSFKGFWKMTREYWSVGLNEYYRSLYKEAFVKALQKLVPEITSGDISPSPAGVRAQALGADGRLLDDFVIKTSNRMIHVINSPSPAATSSFAIGEHITHIYLNK